MVIVIVGIGDVVTFVFIHHFVGELVGVTNPKKEILSPVESLLLPLTTSPNRMKITDEHKRVKTKMTTFLWWIE